MSLSKLLTEVVTVGHVCQLLATTLFCPLLLEPRTNTAQSHPVGGVAQWLELGLWTARLYLIYA